MNPDQTSRLPQPTILVTDDNPAIFQLVGTVLKAEGYRVSTARSPFEALHVAQRQSAAVDLLLSDFEMPTMNGPALWREMKRWHPQVKLILMSGSAGLISVPCVPLLGKPFTLAATGHRICLTFVGSSSCSSEVSDGQ